MRKVENPKKESKRVLQKKEGERRRPVVRVYRRAASTEEAATIDRALGGLLAETIRQVRAAG